MTLVCSLDGQNIDNNSLTASLCMVGPIHDAMNVIEWQCHEDDHAMTFHSTPELIREQAPTEFHE